MAVATAAAESPYTNVLNGRFKGGYITRHFGRPSENIHAIQLELAQHCYMDEGSRDYDLQAAARLINTLQAMLAALLTSAGRDSG